MMAHGEVGWPAGRPGEGAKLPVAGNPAPGAAKPAAPADPAGPPIVGGPNDGGAANDGGTREGALATGLGAARCAVMTSGGMISSKTTTMRSRRRLVDRILTA